MKYLILDFETAYLRPVVVSIGNGKRPLYFKSEPEAFSFGQQHLTKGFWQVVLVTAQITKGGPS